MERIKKIITVFDIPGGVILGLWSLTMLALSILAWKTGRDIPGNVKEIFNWVLTAFAASKTLKTIFGKVIEEPKQ